MQHGIHLLRESMIRGSYIKIIPPASFSRRRIKLPEPGLRSSAEVCGLTPWIHNKYGFQYPTTNLKHAEILFKYHFSGFYCKTVNEWILVETLMPKQTGEHFADDSFSRIFLTEIVCISIKKILKSAPQRYGLARNMRQTLAWTTDGQVHWRISMG